MGEGIVGGCQIQEKILERPIILMKILMMKEKQQHQRKFLCIEASPNLRTHLHQYSSAFLLERLIILLCTGHRN